MKEIILETQHLKYGYSEGVEERVVFDDVCMTIERGETVALVGASGSGKSTLLNLLGGIDTPASGDVLLEGQSLNAMGEPKLTLFRLENIGFIYQRFNLIPTLTVSENVGLPLELKGVPSAQRKVDVKHWLNRVELADRANAFPDQLSGGEQQRVAIARALIHQPNIILADEPTGNLDAHTGSKVLDLLLELVRDNGSTLLIVTHSKVVAERTGRVLQLVDGACGEETPASMSDVAW